MHQCIVASKLSRWYLRKRLSLVRCFLVDLGQYSKIKTTIGKYKYMYYIQFKIGMLYSIPCLLAGLGLVAFPSTTTPYGTNSAITQPSGFLPPNHDSPAAPAHVGHCHCHSSNPQTYSRHGTAIGIPKTFV